MFSKLANIVSSGTKSLSKSTDVVSSVTESLSKSTDVVSSITEIVSRVPELSVALLTMLGCAMRYWCGSVKVMGIMLEL